MAKEGVQFADFLLQRRLGVGGMAEVFLAKREGPSGFEKQLVVKRLLPHLASRKRFTEMFLQEARFSAVIDHPNFVHVSSFGEEDGHYYLAMEYVDGLTLRSLMEKTGSGLTPGVAARIVIDLLDALHAIHNAKSLDGKPLNLVHRDVTPRNVMITSSGAVKLLDLGIAVSQDDEIPDRAGTRRYMSPEQARGKKLDARSDLYCVGLLLKELVDDEAPVKLQPIIEALLMEDPQDRPASAREVQDRLERFALTRGTQGTRGALAKMAATMVAHAPTEEVAQAEGTASVAPATGFSDAEPKPTRLIPQALEQAGPTVFDRPSIPPVDNAPTDEMESAQEETAPETRALLEPRTASLPSARDEPAPGRKLAGGLSLALIAGLGFIVVTVLVATLLVRGMIALSSEAPEPSPPPAVSEAAPAAPDPVLAPPPHEAEPADALQPSIERPTAKFKGRRKTKRKTRRRKRRPPERATVDPSATPPATGPSFLTVAARPWADVYVDGRRVGQTPISKMEIPVGRHLVRLKNPEMGLEASFQVDARPGQVVKLKKRFEN